jgi:hypothetical protein
MRPTILLVPSFPDDFSLVNQHCPHHRVRGNMTGPKAGQIKTPLYEKLVVHDSKKGNRSNFKGGNSF